MYLTPVRGDPLAAQQYHYFFFLQKGSFIILIHFFFQDPFSWFRALIRNMLAQFCELCHSVLSPPAVDEASVTKLASQKSLQFLNSSFSEYYIYTICI